MRGRTVVVVDDQEDVRVLLALVLRALGHRVTIARDGPVALDLVRKERPDVVVVDIGLPGMDGHEVARRLRAEHGPRIRLVALTGSADPDDAQAAIAAGFDAHFTKPLRDEEIERLV